MMSKKVLVTYASKTGATAAIQATQRSTWHRPADYHLG